MRGKYLLDTNAAIAVLEGVISAEAWGEESEVYLSVTALGELLYGAEKSSRVESNMARVARLVTRCPVVGVDAETAQNYGEIKHYVQKVGKPIPDNDLWIAASARRHRMTLLARDRHFSVITLEGFVVEAW